MDSGFSYEEDVTQEQLESYYTQLYLSETKNKDTSTTNLESNNRQRLQTTQENENVSLELLVEELADVLGVSYYQCYVELENNLDVYTEMVTKQTALELLNSAEMASVDWVLAAARAPAEWTATARLPEARAALAKRVAPVSDNVNFNVVMERVMVENKQNVSVEDKMKMAMERVMEREKRRMMLKTLNMSTKEDEEDKEAGEDEEDEEQPECPVCMEPCTKPCVKCPNGHSCCQKHFLQRGMSMTTKGNYAFKNKTSCMRCFVCREALQVNNFTWNDEFTNGLLFLVCLGVCKEQSMCVSQVEKFFGQNLDKLKNMMMNETQYNANCKVSMSQLYKHVKVLLNKWRKKGTR
jgi:hypothetical protein